MAKSDKTSTAGNSRTDQVRSAVDMAFHAAGAQLGRERAIDLADELSSAAQRVRDALEDLRPPSADDLKRLDRRLSAIENRLSALEGSKPAAARPAAKARPAAAKAKPAAAKAKSAAAKAKPAAAKAKPAAAKRRPAARRPAGGSGR